jgi:ferredoxin
MGDARRQLFLKKANDMRIDRNKCVGCANCVPVCPMDAICIGSDGYAAIDEEACVECHTCYRGLSVENLPPWPVRYLRRILAAVHLRFQPEPDICPTGALDPNPLSWPRIVRSAFSDPQVTHESTKMGGRGTAEVKTNDVTNRIKEGEAGFVVELGRPGIGVYFREVDRLTRKLAEQGMVFETENPVTCLMHNPENGSIREDVLEEKVLSCIIETKTRHDKVPDILGVIKAIAPSLDTVISLGVSTRCDENGDDPLREVLQGMGFDAWRAKTNLGMGRAGR